MSLHEKMTALADAIREKSAVSEPLSIDEMTSAVRSIAVDNLETVEKITVSNASTGLYLVHDSSGNSEMNIMLKTPLGGNTGRIAVDSDTILTLYTTPEKFGTAAAPDVLAGKTFTSAAGLCTKGTMEAVEETTLTNASTGVFFSQSDSAQEFDITMQAYPAEETGPVLIDSGTKVILRSPADNFGTAEKGDVLEGKTFTSAAGLKLKGTARILSTVSGTSDTASIETGLSSISFLALHTDSSTGSGLIQMIYDGSACHYVCRNSTGSCSSGAGNYAAAEGGVFSWTGTGDTAMADNTVYSWIACGQA